MRVVPFIVALVLAALVSIAPVGAKTMGTEAPSDGDLPSPGNPGQSTSQIKIIDADASFETGLHSVSIPTQAVRLARLFTHNQDAVLTKSLSSVSVTTRPSPVKEIFLHNADAILEKTLSRVSIPTIPRRITELFLHNTQAVLGES
ncbi:hypothetical protein M1O14_04005, partial [Dehalococcoidia bacterium]|nr:hypothetical protein [Dehalococcoidia bacterium]